MFLIRCDATAFNLSMLTSDLWGVIFGFVLFHQSLMWLYFLALVVVVAGILSYHRSGFASATAEAIARSGIDVDGVALTSEPEAATDTSTLLPPSTKC